MLCSTEMESQRARASTAFLQRCVSMVQQLHHKVMPYALDIR